MLQYQQELNYTSGTVATTRRHDKHVDRYLTLINEQAQSEEDHLLHHSVERTPLPLRPTPQTAKSPLHLPRLFLSHTGLLEEARRGRVHFLSLSLRLKRALKELDKSTGREMIKMGLIFVRSGQERQQGIFANDKGSEAYTGFVNQLGWSVDLASHGRYRGGLDPRSTGSSTLYFDNPLNEVIFHEVVRMPTLDDPQQIHKVRFVRLYYVFPFPHSLVLLSGRNDMLETIVSTSFIQNISVIMIPRPLLVTSIMRILWFILYVMACIVL